MMAATDTIKRNKTTLQRILSANRQLILNKVLGKNLITQEDYNNLKSIDKETNQGHVIQLVDNIMGKGEKTCKEFLNLLMTDEDIKNTYPDLQGIELNNTRPLSMPTQETSTSTNGGMGPWNTSVKKDEIKNTYPGLPGIELNNTRPLSMPIQEASTSSNRGMGPWNTPVNMIYNINTNTQRVKRKRAMENSKRPASKKVKVDKELKAVEEPKSKAVKEPKPKAVKEPKPKVVKEPKPKVVKEPKPKVVKEPKPKAVKEPKAIKKPKPKAVKEPKPKAVKEPKAIKKPKPKAVKGPKPKVVKKPQAVKGSKP